MASKKKRTKKYTPPPPRPTHGRARSELMKLRYEIEEDLAAGRIEQHDYDFCLQQIEANLRALDEPLPPGQRIRVVGIPRKKIDTDMLAAAVVMHAENEVRRKRGQPPVEGDIKQFMADLTLARVRRQAIEQEEAEKKLRAARRRFERNKPASLRQATWDWLLDSGLQELPTDGRIGRQAYDYGIVARPELLRSTVIQTGDGVDYVIDRQSAAELAGSGDTITLVRLQDRSRIQVLRADVLVAMTEGAVFDQLDV